MKSRWVKQSILIGIAFFVLIILVVVIGNWSTIKRRLTGYSGNKEAASAPDAEGGRIGSDLSGFLQDDGFFNEEDNDRDVIMTTGTKVSVMMDSVGQDLRIMIIDSFGKLATDAEFVANIEGVGTYKDEDGDGIIYVNHLREGQYFVFLEELEGYLVPSTKTMINISRSIEYKALSDVAYLVISEDDVDVTTEDTGDKLAVKEADGTESTALDAYDLAGKVGIDVSRYNREIDWEAVAKDGIEFAIIRCGYRGASSGSLILDSCFKDNMLGAVKAGIPVGVYFFSQAINETEAIEEASMVIDQCKLYMLDYPIYIDSESAGGTGRADGLSVEERTAVVKAFCQTISNSGYEAGVYASANWWRNNLDAEQLSAYHAWLAQYKDSPDYEGYYDMWQYTSKGTVEGIETKVDLNISYRN